MVESRVKAGAVDCEETDEAWAVVAASDAKRKVIMRTIFDVFVFDMFM
jgi:hypothetical protein